MKKRVVITGLGVISPIGIGVETFWDALLKGVNGISTITSFDTSSYRTKQGGEARGFNPSDYVAQKDLPRMGRTSLFSVAAAHMALVQGTLHREQIDPERTGVIMGTTMGEPQVGTQINLVRVREGWEKVPPALVRQFPSFTISANVAAGFGLHGPNSMITTACAAGNYAIAYAYDILRSGMADVMLAGGADAFSQVAFTGFNRLLSIAPEKCQPFDKNRKGIMVSEGAGMLLLEPLDHALERKAPIIAEIGGYGFGCDAHHMTAPHPEGKGAVCAMQNALQSAGLLPEDVNYISAHGTGTHENDRTETIAIKKVFGSHAHAVPVSSIKSMLGHTMGAASAIEAVTSALAVHHDRIPPTINYEEPDPECDLDYVPNQARAHTVNVVLSNAFAFGGNDAALVIKKFRP